MMIIVILYIHIYVKFQKVIYQPFVTILPNALFFFICNEINDNNMLIRNHNRQVNFLFEFFKLILFERLLFVIITFVYKSYFFNLIGYFSFKENLSWKQKILLCRSHVSYLKYINILLHVRDSRMLQVSWFNTIWNNRESTIRFQQKKAIVLITPHILSI